MDRRGGLEDGEGCPLVVGCYVAVARVDRALRGRRIRFAGRVGGIQRDGRGSYVVVDEWSEGVFTGTTRYARPQECTVRRRPKVQPAES